MNLFQMVRTVQFVSHELETTKKSVWSLKDGAYFCYCAYVLCISRYSILDSRALLRMTGRERRALGNPGTYTAPDWFMAETIKTLLIGQFNTREKLNLQREFAMAASAKRKIELSCERAMVEERNSSAVMSETPKKTCNGTLKNCHCCNSSLAKIFDSICLFRKTAQKAKNLLENLKEIGGIEVLEEDVDVLSTKVCRKYFRKIVGLGKVVHAFRDMCLKSKQIQNKEMHMNARQKRGRNPSSLQAQNNPEKRIRQCVSSQFTVRH